MDTPKFETHIYGTVNGFVVGDNNTVTLIYQGNKERSVPFLAPPRPPFELVGRDDLLRELKSRLFAGGNLSIVALNGLPGVGKSALAVALAYDLEVLSHFHDGVLWAGLGRGADVLSQLGAWGLALDIST